MRILLNQKMVEHIINDFFRIDQTKHDLIYSFAIFNMSIPIPNIEILRYGYYHICDGTPAVFDNDDELLF